MSADLKYWVWLTLAFGSANSRKWNALSHYATVSEAYERISSGDLKYVMPQDEKRVSSTKMEQADKLIGYCSDNGINIYCFDDEDFPDRLRQIYNPPSVLFTYGSLKGLDDSVVISAVGTRKPSKYSAYVTDRICHELSEAGVVIASGFAVGLDSVALRAAMISGGRAIAVLPCGLNYDYPKENASAKKVVARNGAVISEYLPNDRPSSFYFRARNRILAGISLGTLVTQAGIGSGALSTAAFALAQGKDIFCIPPHELFNDDYAGVTGLLRDGAIPVFDARDILNEYYSVYAHKLNPNADVFKLRSESGLFSEEDGACRRSKRVKASVRPGVETGENPASGEPQAHARTQEFPAVCAADLEALSEGKRKILEFISENGAVLFDEIALSCEGVEDIETILTELELDGFVRSLSGNRYAIQKLC